MINTKMELTAVVNPTIGFLIFFVNPSVQEGRHLRFPPSCESPLSLGESGADCRHVTAAKRERQRIFSSVSFATCSQGQIPFCYTGRRACAGATYPCCAIRERVMIDRACEDKLYQMPNPQVPSVTTRQRVARHCYVATA